MVSNEEIIKACSDSLTMSAACSKLKIHFNTFKKRALILGIYKPNKSGKGTNKNTGWNKIPLSEILKGQHPYYQTNKLRIRLIKEGIKEEKCENCGLTEWNNKKLSFELNHKDGNRTNHKIENIEIICPNCHSQTETFRGKNIWKI